MQLFYINIIHLYILLFILLIIYIYIYYLYIYFKYYKYKHYFYICKYQIRAAKYRAYFSYIVNDLTMSLSFPTSVVSCSFYMVER